MSIRILLATGAAIIITSACKEKGEVNHFRVEKPEQPTSSQGGADQVANSQNTAQKATQEATQEATPNAPYRWTLPAGWSAKPASGMRLATIIIPQEESSLEAAIFELGGDIAGNINRWRGQIGLPALAEAEVLPSLEKIDTQLGQGYIALIINPESTDKAMLAAIIPRPSGTSIFIKVTGSTDSLKGIAPPFRTFTQSFKK